MAPLADRPTISQLDTHKFASFSEFTTCQVPRMCYICEWPPLNMLSSCYWTLSSFKPLICSSVFTFIVSFIFMVRPLWPKLPPASALLAIELPQQFFPLQPPLRHTSSTTIYQASALTLKPSLSIVSIYFNTRMLEHSLPLQIESSSFKIQTWL